MLHNQRDLFSRFDTEQVWCVSVSVSQAYDCMYRSQH